MNAIRVLRNLSKKSNHDHYKHASIVLKGGAIQATGYNFNSTHSEIKALSQIWPSKRRNTIVFNLRFTNSGLGNSAPCNRCRKFMIDNGVSQSWYWEDGFLVKEKL
jgi:cytidine deaminase